ncbi:unnamed protein product [marine sediment metagenome]|uniref:Uncharacterized protein n=1 Tax=marine sediment metagenome TaxID=412755 RepID=X0W8L6_9ZZZZ
MNGDKNRIRVYVSHPIRGVKGKNATKEDMEANNRLATIFGKALSKEFPDVEFYVPATHDEFVLIGYEEGILSEEQILFIDCKIIDTCQVVLVYIPKRHISNGMFTEVDHTNMTGKQTLLVNDDNAIRIFRRYLKGLMT